MNTAIHQSSAEPRQHDLATELSRIARRIEPFVPDRNSSYEAKFSGDRPPGSVACRLEWTEALGLSSFERDIALMCAGMELDSRFASLVNSCSPDPTFSLAMAVLESPHWSALSPAGPLRYWRLIEVAQGNLLTTSALRIDERVLHHLVGVDGCDERLRGLVRPLLRPPVLPESHQSVVGRILQDWSGFPGGQALICLAGPSAGDLRALASAVAAEIGFGVHMIQGDQIPTGASERELVARLLEREAVFSRIVPVIAIDAADDQRTPAFIETLQCPAFVCSRERLRGILRPMGVYSVPTPSEREQQYLWKVCLGQLGQSLNGEVERVARQFRFAVSDIREVAGEANRTNEPLWETCRRQLRAQLEPMARQIQPKSTWSNIVLPELQMQSLREIAAQVRQRAKVLDAWGFARKSSRGLGIGALFAGPSGTGKTMAAEVLANELHLDLYRVDLSAVVSKYIGETEKNLGRIFDTAEAGGVILLFDEADALFGKRSEVRDSHDRYANIEVSYLLQRMETFDGLAILTTNQKGSMDQAFWRRLRFVVHFPFPDPAQRKAIWQRIIPEQTPTRGLDWEKLARLNVSGGSIQSIAMNAAFLAADSGGPVQMKHLLHAARSECAKLDRAPAEAEIGGWA